MGQSGVFRSPSSVDRHPLAPRQLEVPVPQNGVGGFPRPRHHGSESLFPAWHTTPTRTQHGLAPVAGHLLRRVGRAGDKPCPVRMQQEPLTAPGTSAPAAVPLAGTAPGRPATSWTRPRSRHSRRWALERCEVGESARGGWAPSVPTPPALDCPHGAQCSGQDRREAGLGGKTGCSRGAEKQSHNTHNPSKLLLLRCPVMSHCPQDPAVTGVPLFFLAPSI